MQPILKGQTYAYRNERSALDGVRYVVIKSGAKMVTLEPIHGQHQLVGLPTFRQPFRISTADLIAAIDSRSYIYINN